jgi:hypothetical protein
MNVKLKRRKTIIDEIKEEKDMKGNKEEMR